MLLKHITTCSYQIKPIIDIPKGDKGDLRLFALPESDGVKSVYGS